MIKHPSTTRNPGKIEYIASGIDVVKANNAREDPNVMDFFIAVQLHDKTLRIEKSILGYSRENALIMLESRKNFHHNPWINQMPTVEKVIILPSVLR